MRLQLAKWVIGAVVAFSVASAYAGGGYGGGHGGGGYGGGGGHGGGGGGSVPDGGNALVMLGSAISALALLRKRG
ncbi:MAG: hypothetical protein NT105_14950 [Verrucomicrobia bacterium]|nr:hypothetical protein [Verrucomicrobiota bacterium]